MTSPISPPAMTSPISPEAELDTLRASEAAAIEREGNMRQALQAALTNTPGWFEMARDARDASRSAHLNRVQAKVLTPMSDPKEHDLEKLRHLAISTGETRRWSQYHNALQAMYERGALVPAPAADTDDVMILGNGQVSSETHIWDGENWVAAQPAADTQEADVAIKAWQDLCEMGDRTSPEEYPDMALITFDELVEVIQLGRQKPAADTRVVTVWRWRYNRDTEPYDWKYSQIEMMSDDDITAQPLFTATPAPSENTLQGMIDNHHQPADPHEA